MSADPYQGLLASLARAFRALGDPDCAKLLGPFRQGATMTQGARVPGTSFELEPAVAAFNLGAMMGEVALAALLPVADFLARKAHNEARLPLRMQDVFEAMLEAGQSRAPWDGAVASITRWLAGSDATLVAAPWPARQLGNDAFAGRLACADAAAGAVRRACLAAELKRPARSAPRLPGDWQEGPDGAAGCEDFIATVRSLFPARQAALISARIADSERVGATPVHEFIALLVRNG